MLLEKWGVTRKWDRWMIRQFGYDELEANGANFMVRGGKPSTIITVGNDEELFLIIRSRDLRAPLADPVRLVYKVSVVGSGDKKKIRFDYPEKKKPQFNITGRKIIALTQTPSVYPDVPDIVNEHFPQNEVLLFADKAGGFLLNGKKVRRQEVINGRVRITVAPKDATADLKWLALLALLPALCMPFRYVKRHPVVGLANAVVVGLCTLRLVIALRVWAGPPYNETALHESIVAVFIVQLMVLMTMGSKSQIGNFIPYMGALARKRFGRTGAQDGKVEIAHYGGVDAIMSFMMVVSGLILVHCLSYISGEMRMEFLGPAYIGLAWMIWLTFFSSHQMTTRNMPFLVLIIIAAVLLLFLIKNKLYSLLTLIGAMSGFFTIIYLKMSRGENCEKRDHTKNLGWVDKPGLILCWTREFIRKRWRSIWASFTHVSQSNLNRWLYIIPLSFIIFSTVFVAPMLGGREKIPFLPIRI